MRIIVFDAEAKSINFKPVRKNKSEAVVTLVTESYNPGMDFGDLMNKNGQVVKVTIEESENAMSESMEARSR
jgi:hypothetical protein